MQIEVLDKNIEQERKAMQLRVAELEKKLEVVTRDLAVTESSLAFKDTQLTTSQNNLMELEELREMKKDIDRKNEQTASLLKIQDMKGKIRVFCRLRPLSEKEIAEKERNVLTSLDELTVEHQWRDEIKQHLYDRVFDGKATQEDVFEDTKAS
ncbi:Kinesin-like protein KIN-14E [Camellia lanceoleosa]|uniref:Kinesin-like protein KIN-14E n=1 Tax=Camellia lanceoleosa TaxID=1840588 RepID=A0ACC0J126_9ERIC|nr:Kinesin-like protein KIN-14E [Camellia lanceoleosa]